MVLSFLRIEQRSESRCYIPKPTEMPDSELGESTLGSVPAYTGQDSVTCERGNLCRIHCPGVLLGIRLRWPRSWGS